MIMGSFVPSEFSLSDSGDIVTVERACLSNWSIEEVMKVRSWVRLSENVKCLAIVFSPSFS